MTIKPRFLIESWTSLVLVLALLLQWSVFSSRLWQRADPTSIVGVSDNDSAAGIDVTQRTWLLGDNGWRTYGPIYYRLASVARWWVDWETDPLIPGDQPHELHTEKRLHFILMLINLFSCFALAWILSSLLLASTSWRMAFVFVFVPILLSNEVRAHLLLLAKPDALFSSLTALFLSYFFCHYRTIRENSRSYEFKIAAFLLGVTAATKLTVLMFFPALALALVHYPAMKDLRNLTLSVLWEKHLKTGAVFFSWVLGFYLLVGFPSTFDFLGSLEFLRTQSRNMSWGDWNFFGVWMQLFSADLTKPILIFLTFAVLRPQSELNDVTLKSSCWMPWWGVFLFLILSCLQLVSKKLLPPFEWYPFPFSVGWMVFSILVINLVHLRLVNKDLVFSDRSIVKFLSYPAKAVFNLWSLVLAMPKVIYDLFLKLTGKKVEAQQIVYQTYQAYQARKASVQWKDQGPWLVALAFSFFVSPTVSPSLDQYIHSYTQCRSEAWQFMSELHKEIKNFSSNPATTHPHPIALVDPMIPYSGQFNDKEIRMAWDMNESFRVTQNPSLIAIKRDYALTYLSKTEGGLELPSLHVKDLKATRAYYRQFLFPSINKTQTRTSDQTQWNLIFPTAIERLQPINSACNFQLWRKSTRL